MGDFKIVTALITFLCVSPSLQLSPVRLKWAGTISRTDNEETNAFYMDNVFVDKVKHIFSSLQCRFYKENLVKECNLRVITHHFDNREEQKICKVTPPEEGLLKTVKDMRFLKADKIIIKWRTQVVANPEEEDPSKRKLVWHLYTHLITPKDCQVTKFYRPNPNAKTDDTELDILYLPYEDHVDVVFETKEPVCGSANYCKIKLDYQLVPLKSEPEAFLSSRMFEMIRIYPLKIGDRPEYFFTALRDKNKQENDVYTSFSQWQNIDVQVMKQRKRDLSYSDANGYANICWLNEIQVDPKKKNVKKRFLNCMSLNQSHSHDIIEIKFKNNLIERYLPNIYNFPDGDIAYVMPGYLNGNLGILIEKFNAQGKCKTLAQIESTLELRSPMITRFSVTDEGNLCVSVVVRKCDNNKDDRCLTDDKPYQYQFFTTCVSPQVPADREYHDCAQNLYLFGT